MSDSDTTTVQEASQLKEQIASLAQKANEKYGELKTYYQQFTELRTELQNKTQGIKAVHTNVTAKQTNIENVETQARTLLTKIQATSAEITKIHTEISNYHAEFVELKEQLNDEDDGLDAIMVFAKTQKDELQKKYEEVIKIQGDTENIRGEIQKIKSDISEDCAKIREWKDEVAGIYGFINAQGLAHSFTERKKELEKSMKFWSIMLAFSTAALVVVLIWIYAGLETNPAGQIVYDLSVLIFRLSFSSPAIFGVWFSAKQYSRERGLLENYAFKAATAKALENYTDLLTEKFDSPKYKDAVLQFVLSSMKNIYRHPVAELSPDDHRTINDTVLDVVKQVVETANEKVVEPVAKVAENAAKISKNSVLN